MNNTLDYYLRLPYRIEIYPDEDGQGYTATIPDLPGCLTQGKTPEEALSSIEEAKHLWLEVAVQEGDHIPEPTQPQVEEYSGRFLARVPRSLHRHLAKRAEAEGGSLNQLVVSLLSAAIGWWRATALHRDYSRVFHRAILNLERSWAPDESQIPDVYSEFWMPTVEVSPVAKPRWPALEQQRTR